ncbi:unnamed protein product [Arabis nemorensis]|uniref:Uncharacterized protein n=1 Tax=Arabis nemorensis TaxID=586526 RepID=A0A565CU84_9BRAS|nr:unnamed protein product [Arabis nemorensis]
MFKNLSSIPVLEDRHSFDLLGFCLIPDKLFEIGVGIDMLLRWLPALPLFTMIFTDVRALQV